MSDPKTCHLSIEVTIDSIRLHSFGADLTKDNDDLIKEIEKFLDSYNICNPQIKLATIDLKGVKRIDQTGVNLIFEIIEIYKENDRQVILDVDSRAVLRDLKFKRIHELVDTLAYH